QRLAEVIQSRIERAEASPVEARQLRVELYTHEQALQELALEKTTARATLEALLSLEPGTPPHLDAPSAAPTPPSPPPLSPEALHEHPAYRYRAMLVELASARTHLAHAERWEDLAVELLFESELPAEGDSFDRREDFIGLGISIPLPWHQRNSGEIEARRKER